MARASLFLWTQSHSSSPFLRAACGGRFQVSFSCRHRNQFQPSASAFENIRFIFCTAWPAAPLPELSIAPIMIMRPVLSSILKLRPHSYCLPPTWFQGRCSYRELGQIFPYHNICHKPHALFHRKDIRWFPSAAVLLKTHKP